MGILSKRSRQIDVYIEGLYEGKIQKVVIDAKNYNKKIDVKHVEAFIAMVSDIGVDKGIIVTSIGFSKSAINRAHNDHGNFELDILRSNDASKYHGFMAVIHKAKYGAMLIPPFAWIFDSARVGTMDFLSFAYPKGLTFEESIEKKEYFAIDIMSKKTYPFTIEKYFESIDAKSAENKFFISRDKLNLRDLTTHNKNITIYENKFDYKNSNFFEFIGIVEFDNFYVISYLLGNKYFQKRNLEKLIFILERLMPMNVQQSPQRPLKKIEDEIKQTIDTVVKSRLSFLQASVCIEFEEFELTQTYINKSLEYFKTNADTLHLILGLALELKENDISIKSKLLEFLNVDIENIIVFAQSQNLFGIFERIDLYVSILESIPQEFLSNKTKGNIHFAIGINQNMDNVLMGLENFNLAKQYFELSGYDGDEMIFINNWLEDKTIKKQIKDAIRKSKIQNNNKRQTKYLGK